MKDDLSPIYQQPQGQILLFGPSRSGKSYLTNEFTKMGLLAIDLEKVNNLIKWYSDKTGEMISKHKASTTPDWYKTHHFLINRKDTAEFLKAQPDCIILAHAWNILECLDLFDKIVYLYVPPEELDRRMQIIRSDHNGDGNKSSIAFMKQRHSERLKDAKRLGIPIIDATQTPEDIYKVIATL